MVFKVSDGVVNVLLNGLFKFSPRWLTCMLVNTSIAIWRLVWFCFNINVKQFMRTSSLLLLSLFLYWSKFEACQYLHHESTWIPPWTQGTSKSQTVLSWKLKLVILIWFFIFDVCCLSRSGILVSCAHWNSHKPWQALAPEHKSTWGTINTSFVDNELKCFCMVCNISFFVCKPGSSRRKIWIALRRMGPRRDLVWTLVNLFSKIFPIHKFK